MATVTGLTAERMIEMENDTVIAGEIVGDDLILEKRGGGTVNAGNVRGPAGANYHFKVFSQYGGVGDGVANDTAALLAAKNAAVAAGGGVLDLRSPLNPNPIFNLDTELQIPDNVDVIGEGGNFVGDFGSTIRCISATARVVFLGQGGISSGFTVDGDGTGDPDGLLVTAFTSPIVVGRTFSQISVINGAGDGWVINSTQNCLFTNCHGISNAGSNWILDKGAGGNKFDRCGGSGHGEYGFLMRQTAGGISPYPTAPAHNQFDHCIWECQNANVVGVIKITASSNNHFISCGAAGNVTGSISSGKVIDIDGTAGALDVHFDSPLITGKNGDYATLKGIAIDGLATVTLTGPRWLQFFNAAHFSDSNLGAFRDYGSAYYASVTNEWLEGTAGDLVSTYTKHTTQHMYEMPDVFTTAWSVKRKADVGIRAYMNYLGELVFTGDGSGFANHGKLGYSVTDDGVQLSGGPFRIGAGHARTMGRQTGVSGAVVIDAKTTSHAVLELTGNVTSVTVNNAKTGQRLTITVRQDATGGRTVTWGAMFNFTSGAAPGLTTASTENSVEFYYDDVNVQWKELNRAVGVAVA